MDGVRVRQNSWSREFQKERRPMRLGQIGHSEGLAFLLRALRTHGRCRALRARAETSEGLRGETDEG